MFRNIPDSGSPSWKLPVETAADLPTSGNQSGDARIVTDTNSIYIWDADTLSWEEISGGGGGSVSSVFGRTGAVVAEDSDYNADQIDYDNSISGLSADNVQDAIDQIDNTLDDIVTLSGVPANSTDLGTFTGSIIPDNQNIKQALQALETDLEAIPNPIYYAGTWDASTNTPTLADGIGTSGALYEVTVAGTQDLGSGDISFLISDKVVYNGTIWQKWDNTDEVMSVFGRTGTVTAQNGDYTAYQVTNVPSGSITSTNLQDAIDELDDDLTDHINDTTNVHGSTSLNTPDSIVERDSSGNFSAGIITATLDGNATNVTGIVALSNGGTNKNLTASAGSIVYSDNDSLELSTVGSSGQILKSGGTSAPTWDDLSYNVTFFVDPSLGNDTTGVGSFNRPFKTLQKAIDSVTSGGGTLIKIFPGTLSESLVTVNNKNNVYVEGFGIDDSQPVQLTGRIVLSGTTTRFRLKNVSLVYNKADSLSNVEIQGTQGRHYFQGVSFARTSPATGTTVLELNGSYQRWTDLINCGIDGNTSCGGTPLAGASLQFIRCDGQNGSSVPQLAISHDNYSVRVIDNRRFGFINHSNGFLSIDGVQVFTGDASGNAINSSATNSPTTNKLILRNANLQNEALSSYNKINKTGNCSYVIDKVNRNPSEDTLTGTRVNYTAPSIDIGYDNSLSSLVAENVQEAIDELAAVVPSGDPNTFAGFDSSGELQTIPGWSIETYSGGVSAYTQTDGSNQTNIEKIRFATALGDGVSGHIDNYNALTSYTATNTDFDIDNFIGFNNNFDILNNATVDNIIMDNITLSGDTSANVTGININMSDNKENVTSVQVSHSSGTINGNFNGYRLDTSGDYSNLLGYSVNTQGTVTGQVDAISLSNTADVGGNYFGVNSFQQGDVTGSYTGFQAGQSSSATSIGSNLFNGNNQADVTDYFNGLTIINSGDILGTGNFTGIQSDNSGATVNYSGIRVNNSGVVSSNANPVQIYDSSNSPDANFTGIQGSFSGTYKNVQGLSVNVSSATSIENNGRKTALTFEGGGINGFSPFTTISDNPNVVDSGNTIITQFVVEDGSPIENTSVIANNLSGLVTFNDDFSGDPFYGLGYAMVGFSGQLAVASGKTVDSVSMALGGASIPANSTGGTVDEVIMFNAKGLLPAGGTINVDTLYGLKVDAGFSTMSPTQAYGVYVGDSNADNYFEGDITKINGVDTSFPSVQGGVGSVLTNDGSGNLTWETPAAAATRYIQTFNNTTDWTLNSGVYEITILETTHGKGLNPIIQTFETVGGNQISTGTTISVNASGDVTLQVTEVPDNRYTGKVIIL